MSKNKILPIISLGVLISCLLATTGFVVYANTAQLPDITINGVVFAEGQTQIGYSELSNKISENNTILRIKGIQPGNTEVDMMLNEAGITVDWDYFAEQVNSILVKVPNKYQRILKGERYNAEHEIYPRYIIDRDKLEGYIDDLFVTQDIVSSSDAYIAHDGGKYVIVDAVQGNNIQDNAVRGLVEQMGESLNNGQPTVYEGNLHVYVVEIDDNFYVKPKIVSTNQDLVYNCQVFNEHLNLRLILDCGAGKAYELTAPELVGLYKLNYEQTDKAYNRLVYEEPFTLQEEYVKDFVTDISNSLVTMGKSSRDFMTHDGTLIQITEGDYGWWVNQGATVEDIMAALPADKNESKGMHVIKADVSYRQEANSHDTNDYGSTYVEISLAQQKLWYYKLGKIVFESDIVSGNPNTGHATPTGIYSLTYKSRNATLSGPGYSTKVSYWMPFNEDVGMHDASWQSSFGGKRYLTNGSHGCINMPPSKAKELYGLLGHQYDCVIVY